MEKTRQHFVKHSSQRYFQNIQKRGLGLSIRKNLERSFELYIDYTDSGLSINQISTLLSSFDESFKQLFITLFPEDKEFYDELPTFIITEIYTGRSINIKGSLTNFALKIKHIKIKATLVLTLLLTTTTECKNVTVDSNYKQKIEAVIQSNIEKVHDPKGSVQIKKDKINSDGFYKSFNKWDYELKSPNIKNYKINKPSINIKIYPV